jgi:hypothetical protein
MSVAATANEGRRWISWCTDVITGAGNTCRMHTAHGAHALAAGHRMQAQAAVLLCAGEHAKLLVACSSSILILVIMSLLTRPRAPGLWPGHTRAFVAVAFKAAALPGLAHGLENGHLPASASGGWLWCANLPLPLTWACSAHTSWRGGGPGLVQHSFVCIGPRPRLRPRPGSCSCTFAACLGVGGRHLQAAWRSPHPPHGLCITCLCSSISRCYKQWQPLHGGGDLRMGQHGRCTDLLRCCAGPGTTVRGPLAQHL